MSIADKLLTVAQNQQKVYDAGFAAGQTSGGFEAGKQAEYDRFWNAFQDNGNRTNYQRAFGSLCWVDDAYDPKYPFHIPVTSSGEATGMYANSRITDTKVPIVLSSELTAPVYTQMFYYASNLVTITELVFSGDFVHNNANFQGVRNLENITFGGTITQSGLNLSYCTKLTADSMLSLFNCLADYSEDTSGATHTVTLGTTNLNKLTNEQKAVATQKGWTLA